MSGPTRQRSLRERLHGIGISWQGRKSKSYHSKDGQKFPETESKKTSSLDSRSCDPIPSCDEDSSVVQSLETESSKEAKKGSSPPPDVPSKTVGGTPEKPNAKTMDFKEPSAQPEKKLLSRSFTQPQGTQEYKVQASDTLPGIAARFETTPSELAKLNRLAARVVFPGQLLFVPEKKTASGDGNKKMEDKEKTDSAKPHEDAGDRKTSEGNASLPCGAVVEEEPLMPLRKTSVTDPLRIPYRRFSERLQRFLKVKARHFTDGQGVVSGVLIITPNAVMFDPNVSDPLVIEHGTESYGVIAPLDMVMRTAIYFDIAHMKVKNAPETPLSIPKPDVYYGKLAAKTVESSVKEPTSVREGKDAAGGDTSRTESELNSKPNTKSVHIKTLEPDSTGTNPEMKDTALVGDGSDRLAGGSKAENREKCDAVDSAEKAVTTSDKSVSGDKKEAKPVFQDSSAQGTSMGPKASRSLEEKSDSSDKSFSDTKGSSASDSTTTGVGETSLPQMDAEKPTESRRERMLKRLSYPMESITSYTQSSISRILSSSPKSLVDFSSGLFVRNSEEEKLKDQDQTSGTEKGNEEVVEEEEGQEGESYSEPSSENAEPDRNVETPRKPSNEEEKQPSAISASESTEQTSANVTIGYKNLVGEKPEIFAVLDKLLGQKAAQDHEDPPLYLCLRMGHPKERKVLLSTPILSYGKKRVKSEYWFSIPQHRVDDLYNFIQQWIPNLYGDVDEVDPDAIGFTPIDDTEDEEEEEEEEKDEGNSSERDGESQEEEGAAKSNPRSFLRLVEDHFGFRSISPTDWEVLSMIETDKVPSIDLELPLPELMAPSEIFNESHVKHLYTLLPARAVGYPWTLIFSTSTHGFNLKTLYRNMASYDAPIMLAVADTEGAVFGAMLPTNLRESNHFYGTGESFLFTFHPEFKVFNWTGVNNYFIKGDSESIAIGAGDGQFGLWIDGDLYRGSSKTCQTYDNVTLSASEDFVIKALEVWGFM